MKTFEFVDNYVYLYHTNEFIILPTWPDSLNDSSAANFNKNTPLSRSAPIYSYSNSGPRTLQFTLHLHRDIMNMMNEAGSNIRIADEINSDDYVDILIKRFQAMALPQYSAGDKMVSPPMVAVRFGSEIFIKGVVDGTVSVTYQTPILRNDKYAVIDLSFNVSEIEPYSASDISKIGSFRDGGLNKTLEGQLYVKSKR